MESTRPPTPRKVAKTMKQAHRFERIPETPMLGRFRWEEQILYPHCFRPKKFPFPPSLRSHCGTEEAPPVPQKRGPNVADEKWWDWKTPAFPFEHDPLFGMCSFIFGGCNWGKWHTTIRSDAFFQLSGMIFSGGFRSLRV